MRLNYGPEEKSSGEMDLCDFYQFVTLVRIRCDDPRTVTVHVFSFYGSASFFRPENQNFIPTRESEFYRQVTFFPHTGGPVIDEKWAIQRFVCTGL